MSNPMNPLAFPQPTVSQVGQLVPLGHAVIKVDVSAETTMPDTPNGYTAALKVMADQGDLDTTALQGKQGPPGDIGFQVREEVNPYLASVSDLPILSDSPTDIGKYFLIEEYDSEGVNVGQWAYFWYGTSYRKMMMGAFGPPGQVPKIIPEVELIDPPTDANGNQYPSYVETSGPRQEPTWLFELAVMPGPAGTPTPLALFPDVDTASTPPQAGDLIAYTGGYTADGAGIWANFGLGQLLPTPHSMPESAFEAYSGVAQQAAIGSFQLPAQPYPWTAVVWGHIGATLEANLMLTGNPFMIGCQVLLGDAAAGQQVARGLGNTMGVVNIMPHYSDAGNPHNSITPANKMAIVPANTTDPAQTTLYINLWNDGQLGAYDFQTHNAQLFVLQVPVLEEHPTAGGPITTPGTPVKVVQTTDKNLLGIFGTPVTAGNAVVVIAGGWASVTNTTVVAQPPTLDGVTPPGTFAVFNPGSTNCIQSPGGSDPGGYWVAIWVMPDCLNNNGINVPETQTNVGLWDWTAMEVSGLGATPIVDVRNSGSGANQANKQFTSGWSGVTRAEDELILGAVASGGGTLNTLPGTPWTTTSDVYGGLGYQIQSVQGGAYSWAGTLNTVDSWVAGVAAIRAQGGATTMVRRRRNRRRR